MAYPNTDRRVTRATPDDRNDERQLDLFHREQPELVREFESLGD